MFICEICKKNQATVHLTDIHNEEKKELHLCQTCAEAKGISFNTNFSLPDLLAGLTKKRADAGAADATCDQCGLRYSEFQARGRFGCANDYAAFHDELLPMIERIHGKTEHIGKRPAGDHDTAGQKELADLQRRMRAAVGREAYEEAAELRDAIERLKQDMQHERQ